MMEFTGSSIRFSLANLFGVTFEQYKEMFGMRGTAQEREQFLEYCKWYKYYCDQNLKDA